MKDLLLSIKKSNAVFICIAVLFIGVSSIQAHMNITKMPENSSEESKAFYTNEIREISLPN